MDGNFKKIGPLFVVLTSRFPLLTQAYVIRLYDDWANYKINIWKLYRTYYLQADAILKLGINM